ncbi:transcription initiation factor TFIID subunit A-domain-containing protein [Pelagophyceae sp. CCMP2097]|nr:transcription initiation factor TFIID subunit A-domain-containing protein [Pelagophyceae sp. CCMP2097]
MALPKGKTISEMAKLRPLVDLTHEKVEASPPPFDDSEAPLALPPHNADGSIGGDLYGARLAQLLREVDPNFKLEPGAEALVLQMADDFVTRVTQRAAEYAKHRNSETLDAIDLQLCLEKHWGIRIPGTPTIAAPRPPSLAVPWTYRRPNTLAPPAAVENGAATVAAAPPSAKKRKAPP